MCHCEIIKFSCIKFVHVINITFASIASIVAFFDFIFSPIQDSIFTQKFITSRLSCELNRILRSGWFQFRWRVRECQIKFFHVQPSKMKLALVKWDPSHNQFHFKWLNIEGINTPFPIRLTLYSNHLN